MGKTKVLSATFFSAAMLLLAACGNEEKTSGEEKEPKTKTEETETTSEETEEKEEPASDSSGEQLNPNIAEESEGNVEVIYTNKEPNYVHKMDGFNVSVDEYQIVKVTEMNQDHKYSFDDQTEGYVVTAKVTLDNTRDKKVVYNNMYRLQVSSESDFISSDMNRAFVKEEFPKSKTETEVNTFAAGEKVSGLISFTLTNAEFDSLKSVKPKFVIEGGAADDLSMKGMFQGHGVYDFVYSGEQKEQVASEASIYPDKLTTDNLADKKMIFEKSGINETQQIGDINVTLEGVQYAEVIPTEANKERFKNFGDTGIVALTVKLKLDNQSSDLLDLWGINSKVAIDKDRGNVLSQSMVEPREPQEIKAGEQGEKYHVFMFRKDEFELYKQFDLTFGPFIGDEGKDLYKGKTVTFTLPR
ncbi:DUF5068 domain-containing protein [Bacillus sp. UMB0893]|uniref:DUF5068 domain-containing protein n=1 Tax=Bacillus sp. UMB0893 TaxID=2066053 RepID=UPI0008AA10FE|nr:DUF5068 domain-containing protein [Bacillus sp. UMB0893]OHR74759.1 hypothetical protein HMPREF3291_00045 [Bacillus sp. HMSC76G11]PLR65668.1 DUF5068 domain-containing protein [Bacillus sp. UMB0893]